MNLTIREDYFVDIFGFAGVAENRDWAGTGLPLMNRMWQEVTDYALQHKGRNIWLYEPDYVIFTGLELASPPPPGSPLEHRKVHLPKYVYHKHIGHYSKIPTTFAAAKAEMEQQGIKTRLPYLEIYGHWTNDETRLETEMLWCID